MYLQKNEVIHIIYIFVPNGILIPFISTFDFMFIHFLKLLVRCDISSTLQAKQKLVPAKLTGKTFTYRVNVFMVFFCQQQQFSCRLNGNISNTSNEYMCFDPSLLNAVIMGQARLVFSTVWKLDIYTL